MWAGPLVGSQVRFDATLVVRRRWTDKSEQAECRVQSRSTDLIDLSNTTRVAARGGDGDLSASPLKEMSPQPRKSREVTRRCLAFCLCSGGGKRIKQEGRCCVELDPQFTVVEASPRPRYEAKIIVGPLTLLSNARCASGFDCN